MLKLIATENSKSDLLTSKEAIRICEFFISQKLKSEKLYCQLRELLRYRSFTLAQFSELANILEVDLKKMLCRQICFEALISKHVQQDLSKPVSLPVPYQSHQYSSTTSLSSLLSPFQNEELKSYILRNLQIPKDYIKTHRPLSIKAINDAIQLLKRYAKDNEFYLSSIENCRKFLASDFGRTISNESCLKDLYELSFYNANLIEKSWHYKILNTSHAQITIRTDQSIPSSIAGVYTNTETTYCRLQFIKSISDLCGYEGVRVIDSSNISQDSLVFSLDFRSARKII